MTIDSAASGPPPEPKGRPEGVVRRPLRASDADREAVVEQLREAAAEGRLDMEELDERLGLALTAKTVAELVPLTDDLVPEEYGEREAADAGEPLVVKGGVHGRSKAGAWQVPSRIVAHGGMGGVTLDFTRTVVRHKVIEVEAHGGMASVVLIVPEGWQVDSDGVDPGIGGLWDKTKGEPQPGTPLVRVSGNGSMGGIYVRNPGLLARRKLRRSKEG
ncbi:DUF1707 domain-containing protein [Streptomyces sp. NBC_00237]|uniref:DUF1707 SHOCT-like domain-containing protein n=1 Tax=Streptomyces sp. NBC_00237 TaxID=2975687 RepID=UPI0022570291|nr:DUF1707 domain-containing protein [Streptomyces sp. NBC_00237]MCX5204507.1 DUF1707 domain-containing protein [Streptomyces sp. NBC_00237]